MTWELEEEMAIDSEKLHILLRTTIHIFYINFGDSFRETHTHKHTHTHTHSLKLKLQYFGHLMRRAD